MKIQSSFFLAILFTIISSLNTQTTENNPVVFKGIAILKGRYGDSNISGTVTFTQILKGNKLTPIIVSINLTGFEEILNEQHGLHIHAGAIMSTSDDPLEYCRATGPHYNPKNLTHGDLQSSVKHFGDYGNVESNNGSIIATIIDKTNKLFGPLSIIGHTVVLHRNRDDLGVNEDLGSQTSGNAGPRIACGVIGRVCNPNQQKNLNNNNLGQTLLMNKKNKHESSNQRYLTNSNKNNELKPQHFNSNLMKIKQLLNRKSEKNNYAGHRIP